jgi:simple sugar transport system substrate-binding protein
VAAAGGSVKLAFMTKFPVSFFTAMQDAAKAYAAKHPGVDITYFSCKSPADTACQIAQIEDAVAKGFQAIVVTPMGVEVVPALDAAAAKGVKVVLADNALDAFKKKTAVAATDNVKGGQITGAYLKSVLKSGDTIGLMEGVRGVPALDARIRESRMRSRARASRSSWAVRRPSATRHKVRPSPKISSPVSRN